MRDTDGTSADRLVAGGSALALAFGVLMGLVILAGAGEVIVFFLLLCVFPALAGYWGLERTGYLPWDSTGEGADEDLMGELKRRYARGELDDDELERKVETLLAGGEGAGTAEPLENERETARSRR